MKKFLTICWFIVVVTPLVVQAKTTPAFWQVSKGSASVYLLGSMHFGRDDFYPMPKEVLDAYSQSERLVVEVDMTKVSPKVAMQSIFKYGALPTGQTLQSVLSENAYGLLDQQCKTNNLPVSAFNGFQPWFVALQLLESEIKKTELKQQLGIDLHFLGLEGKPVDELETVDSQLAIFSQFTLPEQEFFLVQTIRDLKGSQKYLTAMADAWQGGDIDLLEEQIISPFKNNKDTKKLYTALFTERNIEMTAAVIRYLKNAQKVFFIVGAGHMIGTDGIVHLLEKQGYQVKRVHYQE